METTRRLTTITGRQDKRIDAQAARGNFENDSNYIRDLIRRGRARCSIVDSIRAEQAKGEQSGKPRAFDGAIFERTMAAGLPELHAEYRLLPEAKQGTQGIQAHTPE